MVYRRNIVWLPLFGLLFAACSGTEIETVDPRIEQIRSARQIIFDSGSMKEQVYSGEELEAFLDQFELDTFQYGPYQVRLVSGCRGGSMRIERRSYLFSLCKLKSGGRGTVLAVAMGDDIVRMVERKD